MIADAKPNWCNPCGRYHSRDYEGCERRASNRHPADEQMRAEVDLDQLADMVADRLAARGMW